MQVRVLLNTAYVFKPDRLFLNWINIHSPYFCYLYIQVERGNDESEQAIFSVPDYTGNACKSVGMV